MRGRAVGAGEIREISPVCGREPVCAKANLDYLVLCGQRRRPLISFIAFWSVAAVAGQGQADGGWSCALPRTFSAQTQPCQAMPDPASPGLSSPVLRATRVT